MAKFWPVEPDQLPGLAWELQAVASQKPSSPAHGASLPLSLPVTSLDMLTTCTTCGTERRLQRGSMGPGYASCKLEGVSIQ